MSYNVIGIRENHIIHGIIQVKSMKLMQQNESVLT